MLARPDVGAVAVDHERKVAEHADRPARLARALPLPVGNPLQVLVVAKRRRRAAAVPRRAPRGGDRAAARPTRASNDRRARRAARGRARSYRATRPPARRKRRRPCARASRAETRPPKVLEREPKARALAARTAGVVNTATRGALRRPAPVLRPPSAAVRRQPGSRPSLDGDEDWIDGHRAQRRIRRALAHLASR